MKKTQSAAGTLLPILCLLMALLIGAVALVCQIYHNMYLEQTDRNISNVKYHIGRIDQTIHHADRILYSNATQNADLLGLTCSEDPDRYRFYQYGIWKHFAAAEYDLPYVAAYFFYTDINHRLTEVVKHQLPYEWRKKASSAIAERMHDGTQTSIEMLEIDGKNILLRTLRFPGLCIGYWLLQSDILNVQNIEGADEMHLTLFAGNGQSQSITMQPGSKTCFSNYADFGIVVESPYGLAWQTMEFWEKVRLLIPILPVVLCSVWLIVRYIRFFLPMEKLMRVMAQVGKGDTGRRMKINRYYSNEISQIGLNFNRMMDRLQELQKRNEEQLLCLKNSEMERLKLQINPHFFINVMNAIRSFAMLRRMQPICEMTVYLSDYFRFILRRDVQVITLSEEINHTNNFMRIQQYRFADKLQYKTNIAPECMDAKVPILLVHTFVDNAVRYVLQNEEACIEVWAQLEQQQQIRLTISDTGCGFEQEMLDKLNRGISLSHDGKCIGIANLTARMEDLYQGKAKIRYANQPSGNGAVVEITFPYLKKEELPHV